MKKYLAFAIATVILAGCNSSKNVVYMQDIEVGKEMPTPKASLIKVHPGDMLSINVTCRFPELAQMFNPMEYTRQGMGVQQIGSSNSSNTIGTTYNNTNSAVMPYLVNEKGNINFPVLGDLHVEGMTRQQIADLIRNKIIAGNYIEDPRVNVTFMNLHYTMLGEVMRPGTYYINDDKVTILDAIAKAGDLGIQGKRDAIYVTRTDNGKRTTYKVDIRKADIYDSPVYYLQQDDVVYVEPNSVRAGQSTVNENSLRSIGMWMSIASFLMSLALFIKK